MLVAICDARGAASARARLGGIVVRDGEPDLLITGVDSVIAAWSSGTGTPSSFDKARSCVVEGRISWEGSNAHSPLVLADLPNARGDFAMAGATSDGVLIGAGPAGGYRPFYVGFPDEGATVASTSMSHLLATLPARPPLSVECLALILLEDRQRAPRSSPYRGVEVLPIYEAWHLRPGRVEARVSTFRPEGAAETCGSAPELAEILRRALRETVQRSLDASRNVAVMVSGGLDSSGVLATTCKLRPEGVEAFTWDYASHHGDDRPYLDAVCSSVGLTPHRLSPAATGLAPVDYLALDALPCPLPAMPLVMMLDRRCREAGADLLLTGYGGDNVLDGDPTIFAALALRGHVTRAVKGVTRLRGHVPTKPWRLLDYLLRPALARLEPGPCRVVRRRHTRRVRWGGPRLHHYSDETVSSAQAPCVLEMTTEERFAELARAPFIPYVARARAQEELAARILRRDPLLDESFLRTVAAFPPLTLLHGDFLRGLYREALKGLVPDQVRLRVTKSLMEPALTSMMESSGGFAQLEPLADVRRLADLGLVEPRAFRSEFDALVNDPMHRNYYPAWLVVTVEAFVRDYDGDRAWKRS